VSLNEIVGPQAVPVELKQPLIELLLGLADDEFILGYWDSEWTGVAPMLEEDVAMSSIAQDEIGHARLLYQRVAELTGTSIDQLAYGRQPGQYRQVQLVERHRGNWAFTIARQFLYDTADQLRVESLKSSSYVPLAQDIAKIEREEVYHQMHVHIWLERLVNRTPEARHRLEQALEQLWPDALGMFEPFPGEDALLRASILTIPSARLQQEWLATIAPVFERLHLDLPIAENEPEITSKEPESRGADLSRTDLLQPETGRLVPAPLPTSLAQTNPAASEAVAAENVGENTIPSTIASRIGGRRGQHTQDFRDLWEQMTMVYCMEPQAQW
jgi:ring-1,2-phenylacetyl-CoA epoxidase subunit PaaC